VKRVGFSARRSRNRYSAFGQQLNFNFKSLEPIVQVPRLFPEISRLNFYLCKFILFWLVNRISSPHPPLEAPLFAFYYFASEHPRR
jgi:hypothetical protein